MALKFMCGDNKQMLACYPTKKDGNMVNIMYLLNINSILAGACVKQMFQNGCEGRRVCV